MPPCQPAKPVPALDGGLQAGELLPADLAHRVALHDEVASGHVLGVGIDLRRVLDPDVIARALEVTG